ncbi:MAG: DUF58 domain-containing protein [Candidatus Hydromicrobium americanum]|nr:MAG: DUF58 domain-containing protein [Candidatus Hydromicrobium americanum]
MWFDPKVLSKIKPMELRAKLIVEGFLVGMHRSPYHGFSVEFREHRPYQPGDEPKRIDWKIYARQERLYTKQFEEETNSLVHIILDGSNSMSYGSNHLTKFEYAATLSACLSWLLIHQRDAVSFTIFDEKISSYLPPSGTKLQLSRILQTLDKAKPSYQTKIPDVLNEISARIKKKGIVIFLSDLLAPEADIIKALKNIRYRKNEVIVFHILDPAELHLPFKESAIIKDIETHEKLPITPDIKQIYQKELQKFIDTYRQNFHLHNIDYLLLPTSEPLEKSLVFYLARRRKRPGLGFRRRAISHKR